MSKTLTIGEYMVPCPHGIEPHLKLRDARKKMETLHVQHLPVQIGGRVVGILSGRDIQYIAALKDMGPWEQVSVEEAMSPEPYKVRASEPMHTVLEEMAARHYGSVLVTDENDRLEGIFTSTDGLRLLAEFTRAPKRRTV